MCFHGQVENNLVDRYMANDNFYKMSQIDGRIKDPEQRIGEAAAVRGRLGADQHRVGHGRAHARRH